MNKNNKCFFSVMDQDVKQSLISMVLEEQFLISHTSKVKLKGTDPSIEKNLIL